MIARSCCVQAHYSFDYRMLQAAVTVAHRTLVLRFVFCLSAVFWLPFFRWRHHQESCSLYHVWPAGRRREVKIQQSVPVVTPSTSSSVAIRLRSTEVDNANSITADVLRKWEDSSFMTNYTSVFNNNFFFILAMFPLLDHVLTYNCLSWLTCIVSEWLL